jgi:hypothetical protein
VLSVLLRPWDRRIERSHELLRRRIYVDDLTFWARGDAGDAGPAVASGLAITAEFEAAMGWRLNTEKSAQFANTAALRRWLSLRHPAIPATTQVKDVGVIAAAGRARRAPVSAARLLGAAGRFQRVGRLPVPFDWRCRLGAAAGTASGVYGAACGAPPARELEALRRAARAAVCHGGLRAAAEVVFGLLSPTWRLDPKAVSVIAPVLQAARAMRHGRFPHDVWRTTAAAAGAGCGRGFGPVAATLRSLACLGLGSDVECWSGVPAAPLGWRPAEQPLAASKAVLLEAWRRAQWAEVAARRQDFAHVAGGVDRWATRRLLESGALARDAAGALRVVLSGNVITERVAARWTGRAALCPHCGLEAEDKEHRHWR